MYVYSYIELIIIMIRIKFTPVTMLKKITFLLYDQYCYYHYCIIIIIMKE